jgi:hypothetical protein
LGSASADIVDMGGACYKTRSGWTEEAACDKLIDRMRSSMGMLGRTPQSRAAAGQLNAQLF